MAITKVSSSTNLDKSIDYDIGTLHGGHGQAHKNKDGLKKRVLACWGVNASNDPQQFKAVGNHIIKNSPGIKPNSVQCIRKIIAFQKKPKKKIKSKKIYIILTINRPMIEN